MKEMKDKFMNLKLVTTTFEHSIKRIDTQNFEMVSDAGEENGLINLYPEMNYQTFEGFGGAITDSAGFVYAQMNKEQKETLLKTYFEEDQIGYSFVRIPMDSCDFSLEHYEAMSDPDDLSMKSFSLERTEKYIFPLLDDAQKMTKNRLEIMVTPWSPPAFMKTNGERNHGGKLKEEYKSFWAEYICKYIREFRKRGYLVRKMSLQNEPKAVQEWDSCVYTAAEEKDFLKNYMYPSLLKNNLEDVEIYIWDHNKERVFERACDLIDEDTNKMIAGIAFHWYSGDHFEALKLVQEKFPGKKLILSEACIEYSKFSQGDDLVNAQKYAHDIIGDLNNGMTAFYDWNIVLDEKGGPNHVSNYCDAPFLFDTKKETLVERNTLEYLNHFSHYIRPGAIRIAHSSFTEKLEVTAFKNVDNSIIVVILNQTDKAIETCIRLKETCAKVMIQRHSIVTAVITSPIYENMNSVQKERNE